MPLFGLFCMIVFLYLFSRIFGSGGGLCGRRYHQVNGADVDELRREIQELRNELKTKKGDIGQQEDAS